jgi:membrane-bound lytic murein transglycosylase B
VHNLKILLKRALTRFALRCFLMLALSFMFLPMILSTVEAKAVKTKSNSTQKNRHKKTNAPVFSRSKKKTFFAPVVLTLVSKNISKNWINRLLNDQRTQFNERATMINMVNNRNPVDYAGHIGQTGIENVSKFLQDHKTVFDRCESQFGVSRQVIAALLWIETKYGVDVGRSHVVSVYLSLALASQPEFLKKSLVALKQGFQGTPEELAVLEENLPKRAQKKSDWAIEQLLALSSIENSLSLDLLEIKGSWAGAFGVQQFIPSSYFRYAADGSGDEKIDPYNLDDAIMSVGRYLKLHGWSVSPESKEKSLFEYNRSKNYVEAILKLANLVQL